MSDDAPTGEATIVLSPTQTRTLDALRLVGDPPEFDVDFVDELDDELTAALDALTPRLRTDDNLWVSKHRIASVLDCEQFHLIDDGFEWTPANAAGTIAHRAIQLMINWRGEPTPADLVDEAMARLAGEMRNIGTWIANLSPGDDADVRGATIERVTQFVECFPPLSKRWHPMSEAGLRWPVAGPIVLSGKVDLVFGKPRGRESRKVIIDLKTGRPGPRHRQDLAFYALLETLVRKVPPRRVATFYLDAGAAHAEDVTEAMLRTALRRTIDGVNRLVELEHMSDDPVRRPGTVCRWCPESSTCDEGSAYLAATLERD